MKRIGNLWADVVSWQNLLHAYHRARKGKRSRPSVESFEFKRELELAQLRLELITESYQPGHYRTFMLHDTKARMISAAPFRDRVVHHAMCNLIEPIFERTFIHDSYASRHGKGTHAAIRRYQQFAGQNRYVLKCDVRRFFPSIDHEILKHRLARKIKDPSVLQLADLIIDNSNRQVAVPGYFPGDDLYTESERRKGLPIGNQTSQFFGNVYLNALDHFVKEELQCVCYLRYVDDFVVLDNSRTRLREVRDEIEQYLHSQRLWLHPTKRVISPTADGLRFLGFRVWPDRVWFNADYVRKTRRRLKRMAHEFAAGETNLDDVRQRIHSWLGHAGTTSGTRYTDDLLSDILFIRTAAEYSCSSGR